MAQVSSSSAEDKLRVAQLVSMALAENSDKHRGLWSERPVDLKWLASKLGKSDEETQFVVIDAILDGLILGKIDQERGMLNCTYGENSEDTEAKVAETLDALNKFRDQVVNPISEVLKGDNDDSN